MKTQRVNCADCENFITSKLEDENDIFSKTIEKAKCKLGNRVMFRNPSPLSYWYFQDFGYIRHCNDFKDLRL